MTNQPSGDDLALASADKQPAAEAGSDSPQAYRVLARKYRPANFADLIGQEATVRTLSNAITSGRVAHAFILTGVRGVGKTTTARILARALNCIGPDKIKPFRLGDMATAPSRNGLILSVDY